MTTIQDAPTGEVTAYMKLADGTRDRAVAWPDVDARALVSGEASEDVAMFIAHAPAALRTALAALANAEREIERLKAQIPARKPARLLGPACVRMTEAGAIWILNGNTKGWGAGGFRFESWDDLFRSFDVVIGKRQTDATGDWWPATNAPARTEENAR